MATFTSKATGNWASTGQTTWNEVGAPGDGDTVTIGNGHTITIAASTSVTVGDSANPTTPAISSNNSNGTGILNMGNGATLTVKGNVRQGNANWTINQDCTINFDHASANLTWQITDDGGTATNAKLIFAGTSGHRITVTSTGAANSGGFGNVTGTKWTRGGQLEATFVNFSKIGTSSLPMLDFRPASSSYSGFFDDCHITSCGKLQASHNGTAGMTFRARRTTIVTPISSDGRWVELLLAAGTHTGIVFDNVVWDGQLYIGGASSGVLGVSFTGECIGQSSGSNVAVDCTNTPCSATVAALFLNRRTSGSGTPSRIMAGTISNLFLLGQNQGTEGNAHCATIVPIVATTITGGVWEMGTGGSTATDETGDQLQVVGNPGSATALTVSQIISPPLGSRAAGALVNVSANSANLRLTIEHCTSYCSENGDAGGAFKSENCSGGAGMVQAIRDNCFVGVSAGNQWVTYTQGATALADGSMVGCDYNNRYNFSTDGYQQADAKFSTPSPPGTHDLTVNPNFVDNTRNLLKWGQSIDGSITTYQQVVDELMKRNDDAGYNSAYTLAAYKSYMQAGFTPTNASLKNAAHDGTSDIGAVPVQIAGSSISSRHRRGSQTFIRM